MNAKRRQRTSWCACAATSVLLLALASGSALAQDIRLAFEPKGPLVLGDVEEATVTITAPETEETKDRPLRVSVNVGSFGPVEKLEPGTYRTTYRLPSTRFPQVAFVAVWRETGPAAKIDFLQIPLSGRAKVRVKTRRRARVVVVVGDESFGPVDADRRGRAIVPLAVPPGVTDVIAQSTVRKETSQKPVQVRVPPYNRLTMAVTPYLVAADGKSEVTVHAYYDSPDPPPIDRVKLVAPEGELTPILRRENRYRFRYVPTRGTTKREVTLAARIEDDKTSQATAQISLGTPIPERLVIKSKGDGRFVADGASQTKINVLVLDQLGLGVPKLAVTGTVSAGSIAKIADLDNGEYEVTLIAPPAYPEGGRVLTTVGLVGNDRPALSQRVDLSLAPGPWPTRATMEHFPATPIADDESSFTVEILAHDAAGQPFDGAKLSLVTQRGVVSQIEAVGEGRYRATVTPNGGEERIDLLLNDASGHLEETHFAPLRPPPRYLTVGVRVGAAFTARAILPAAGVELGLRPPVLNHRLGFYVGALYRQTSMDVDASELLAPDAPIDGNWSTTMALLPVSLGVTVDVHADKSWRMYTGAGLRLTGFAYRVETDVFDAPVERGIAPGGELTVGTELSGFFFELCGAYTALSDDHVSGPALGVGALLGYRLGVL